MPFDLTAATRRVTLLDRLRRAREGDGDAPVVVASVRGLVQLVLGPSDLQARTRLLRPGDRLDVDELLRWATELGYEATPLVQEPGEIARRGGIVDLFPPGADEPVRLDFFGDEIESIRAFDPGSQRSTGRLPSVRLLPPAELPLWQLRAAAPLLAGLERGGLRDEVAGEWDQMLERMGEGATPASVDLFAPYLLDEPCGLADYFAPGDLLVLDEPSAVRLAAAQLAAQATELEGAFVANGELPPGLRRPVASWSTVEQRLQPLTRLELGSERDDPSVVSLGALAEAPAYAGRLAVAVDDVAARLRDGWRVSVASDQVERLTELFEERDVFPRRDKRRGDRGVPPPLPPVTL